MRYDQISPVPPLTPVVKALVITCVAAFIGEEILTRLDVRVAGYPIMHFLGLVPAYIKRGFWWQFVTYIFLHGNTLHILLNMLILWYFGSEMEMRLGQNGFLKYFFVCGVGAGVFNYLVNILFLGDVSSLTTPIIGASGAIYGILLAYGIFFGNRYFLVFFLFPMKAKYFVMIIALVELMMGVQGGGGNVAHFAHLGGMGVGAIYIWFFYMRPRGGRRRNRRDSEREKLKRQFRLIVNHDGSKSSDDSDGPTYWN